ncbi:MAG: hypothetical protein M3O36_15675 [Myxococcota bacterium]|nr:hypothetical protein [Myxococcota bacterium]
MTSSSRVSRILVALVALVIAVVDVGAAHAQSRAATAQELEKARALYKEGKALRTKGQVAAAIEKLRAAHALGNTPVTGIELARTYLLAGRLAEARETSLSVARIPVAADETAKSAQARVEALGMTEELKSRVPTLTISVNGVAPGEAVHVAVDGVDVAEQSLSHPLQVDPGRHEVTVRAGEGPSARRASYPLESGEAEAREVVLDLPPRAAAQVSRDASSPAVFSASPILVRAGFAVAVVGGAIGMLAGTTALNKKNQVAAECPARMCSTPAGKNDLAAARSWAMASTIAFSVTAAGVAGGVVGLLMRPDRKPRGGEVAATFWTGDEGGVVVGVHGRF